MSLCFDAISALFDWSISHFNRNFALIMIAKNIAPWSAVFFQTSYIPEPYRTLDRQFIKWQVASFNLWSNFTASDLLSRLLKLRQTFLICSVSKYWQNVCWIFIPFNAAKLGKQSSIFTTEWVINFIKEPLWVLISVWKRVKGWNLYPLKESNYWCLWWWPISIVNLLQMCN